MKRVFITLLVVLMSTIVFAQKQHVVVGAVGEDPKPGLRKALEAQLKEAFVKDGRYTAVTREEAVLAAVDNEQARQRSGAVDDAQIKQIGKQSGAQFVCVVEISPLLNSYTLSAQFVDIESADIINIASVTNTLRNTTEFLNASEELVRKLLGYAQAPASSPKVTVKHVAVIETLIDTLSVAASEISRADLMEITSVLRREAIKNLPRDRFNIMTSETVQSMGTAVQEDCIDENCIITLGSKIGADYIVRGTLSKLRGRFSLTIEIFETEYGNLVAITPEPIRTADLDELLDKSASGCAGMYKSFAGTGPQSIAPPPAPPPPPPVVTYALTAIANPLAGGTVSRDPDSLRLAAGTKVVVTAAPKTGYVFAGWVGAPQGVDASAPSITLDMTADITLTANFKRITHTLTVSASSKSGGTVSRSPDRSIYDYGTKVTITADPAKGYRFTGWSGEPASAKPSDTVTMNKDMALTANFSSTPMRKAVLTTRWTAAALAAGGFIAGSVYDGKIGKEQKKYDDALTIEDTRSARKNAEGYESSRDLFYILGGIGATFFTVTFFF